MSKKVFLGVGHGGADFGASKYLIEKDLNLAMAKFCKDFLNKHNVEVKMSREKDENDPIMEEVKECNAFNPDLAIDIHNNSGNAEGFEAYYHFRGGKSKTLASNIEKEIVSIGQKSRGIKTKVNSYGKDYFAFIRETRCPSVIVEGCFVDNKKDSEKADESHEQKAFGEAYAKGILKTLGIPINDQSIKVGDKVKVLKNVQYGTNKLFKLYYDKYDVLAITGDRVVIGIGKTITAAVNINNLKKC